jgi:hypothetical protein
VVIGGEDRREALHPGSFIRKDRREVNPQHADKIERVLTRVDEATQPERGYASAGLSRSGVKGARRRRTPDASKTALAMAAATGRIELSPAPARGKSGRLISTMSIASGVSSEPRLPHAAAIYQEGLWICERSALLTGCASAASRASSDSGEMLAFAHIPAGTTTNKGIDIDDLKSEVVAPATAPTAIGADIEIGRASPLDAAPAVT